MNSISIAETLAAHRRAKGITQEELAAYVGVTKASVSKWETGQSYPDILMLPQLAAYFNLSVDDLIGYKPQLTREAIRAQYRLLSRAFAEKPAQEAAEACRDLAKRYYACFPLLYQLGILLANHAPLEPDPARRQALLEEAMGWLARVRTEGEDPCLAHDALRTEAFCLLNLQRPKDAMKLLEGEQSQALPHELLVSAAYQMLGDMGRATQTLQGKMFTDVVMLMNSLTSYMGMVAGDAPRLRETLRRIRALSKAFDLERLHPLLPASAYLAGAQMYAQMGLQEEALANLEEYVRIVTGDIYPLRLHGDGYFDCLDAWLEEEQMGGTLPRSEPVIRGSLVEGVAMNPAFADLAENARFRAALERLNAQKEEA
ncbi:MAG TPA: helix-turn-helix transcriptional regulator [Clostridia bacterium]|nr:helix-turn-helix transcriptional regulator [Clostridia bacterium]